MCRVFRVIGKVRKGEVKGHNVSLVWTVDLFICDMD